MGRKKVAIEAAVSKKTDARVEGMKAGDHRYRMSMIGLRLNKKSLRQKTPTLSKAATIREKVVTGKLFFENGGRICGSTCCRHRHTCLACESGCFWQALLQVHTFRTCESPGNPSFNFSRPQLAT